MSAGIYVCLVPYDINMNSLNDNNNVKLHPRDKAKWLSKITFFYTLKLFKQIYKKPIDENDLYQVPDGYKSRQLVEQLDKHIRNDLVLNENLSLYRVLWKCYGWQYLLIGIMQLIARSISIITIPLYIGKLISFFVPEQNYLSKHEAYTYAFLIIGLNILNCLYLHNYLLLVSGLSIKVRTAFCSLMYRKALKLTPDALSKITTGKMTTLIQKDVRILQEMIRLFNDVWIGFAQALIVCYCIYGKIGVAAALVGCGTFFAILPLQVLIGKRAAVYRTQIGKSADERFQVTKEVLSAIELIKMYTLENILGEKIEVVRRKELRAISKLFLVKVILLLFGTLTSKIAFFFLFITHLWTGNIMAAESIYFILSAFQKLRQAFTVIIPNGIAQLSELQSSLERINGLLVVEETVTLKCSRKDDLKPRITLENISLGKEILNEIIEISEPGLTIIYGKNGCGKTTLLDIIMRNVVSKTGSVFVTGSISYAPQEPWVFPATIKQNILFGEPLHPLRYQKVLTACALREDLERFPEQDLKVIEEKGLNLSKGQKARISLARAIYRNCDIYLLDDPLSSLDSKVQVEILHNGITNFLQNKICIFATHTSQYIHYTNKVVIIDETRNLEKNSDFMNIDSTTDILNAENDVRQFIDNNILTDEGPEEKNPLIQNISTSKLNVYMEKNNSGHVNVKYYKKYVVYGGQLLFSLSISLFIFSQMLKSYTDKAISVWVTNEQETIFQNKSYSTNGERTNFYKTDSSIPLTFSILILSSVTLSAVTAFGFFIFTKKSSRKIHSKMLWTVLRAKMVFFEKTYLGNILNRFSKDLTIIDEEYPFVLYEFIELVMTASGIILLIFLTKWLFLIPEIVLFMVLYIIRHFYMPTGRNLQRLDSATRSSIIGHLNTSLDGLSVIRASNAQEILSTEFDRHQDINTSASYTSECSVRAFGFVLDLTCCLFISVVILNFICYSSDAAVGDVGLAITQSMMLTGLFQYGVRMWADMENKMTSTERAFEYTEIPAENSKGSVIKNWPLSGNIIYDSVSVISYSGQKILKNISFQINSGEKIGIVGRTGAGKTTLVSALYRLHRMMGSIILDGVDINQIDLELLRKSINIVPQDPVLFSGTIRYNIDPKSKYTDEQIWKALHTLQLSSVVKSLDQPVVQNGSNFSSGEKQLLCLSRALLDTYKILILDEATSNIDGSTDEILKKIIKENFKDATVLVIAHKLETILYLDKVMMMDQGMLVEYDKPEVLLNNPNSMFYNMVKISGFIRTKID